VHGHADERAELPGSGPPGLAGRHNRHGHCRESVVKTTRITRVELVVVDLCRARNYADYSGAAGVSVAWPGHLSRGAAERSA
jgi:hypothetical protein